MEPSIRVNTKKRGRPKTTGKGHLVGVRLPSDELEALDKFILEHPDKLSRPLGIRHAMREWLKAGGYLPIEGE